MVEQRVSLGTSVGQLNDPTDLYVIADLSRLWVEMAVAPGDLRLARRGQPVRIGGVGEGVRHTEGEIVFISPFLDPGTRTARVIADPNPDDTWRPGSFVTAEIVIEGVEAAVLVPRAALQTIGGTPAVFVRTPEGFRAQPVTLGRSGDGMVEVTKGLSPGEHIAVANSFALKAELGRGQLED
ncbi:efflux RND transporter periplasmic adaptor subunit [Paeniroseomonas aquatica]|uniref:efflux RND transporter periplasmic adaptor subunit n=1 Tax=Paeniroseomonas aquatica TaxID=373043 RepID=UPI00361C6F2E